MTARSELTAPARFWAKVDKTETCWLWTGRLPRSGYGTLSISGKNVQAHRFAYELIVGPIPAGLQLDHLCRVRHCVNPAHLEPVTPRVNVLRGICPAALAARRSHCQRGHEFTPENTYMTPNGRRQCRACILRRVARRIAPPRARQPRQSSRPKPRTCPRGHLYAGDNLRVNNRGNYVCLTCARDQARLSRAHKAAARAVRPAKAVA